MCGPCYYRCRLAGLSVAALSYSLVNCWAPLYSLESQAVLSDASVSRFFGLRLNFLKDALMLFFSLFFCPPMERRSSERSPYKMLQDNLYEGWWMTWSVHLSCLWRMIFSIGAMLMWRLISVWGILSHPLSKFPDDPFRPPWLMGSFFCRKIKLLPGRNFSIFLQLHMFRSHIYCQGRKL